MPFVHSSSEEGDSSNSREKRFSGLREKGESQRLQKDGKCHGDNGRRSSRIVDTTMQDEELANVKVAMSNGSQPHRLNGDAHSQGSEVCVSPPLSHHEQEMEEYSRFFAERNIPYENPLPTLGRQSAQVTDHGPQLRKRKRGRLGTGRPPKTPKTQAEEEVEKQDQRLKSDEDELRFGPHRELYKPYLDLLNNRELMSDGEKDKHLGFIFFDRIKDLR